MLSAKAEAAPTRAMTHIQKTAPAPPRAMAVATPAMLPVPTREAVEIIRAWKEEMSLPSFFFSPSTRRASGNSRNCTPRVRTVK